jgi:hypothetical protein
MTMELLLYDDAMGSITQYVAFEMNGDLGKRAVIDWGDGTIDSVTLAPSDYWNEPPTTYSHNYETEHFTSRKFISVTGDVENIKLVRFGYDISLLSVSIENLPRLQHFGVNFQISLPSLEVSDKANLETLIIGYQYGLHDVTISNNPSLKFISMHEVFPLSTQAVDTMIDGVYTTATTNNVHEGTFEMTNSDPEDYHNFLLIGPPSEAGLEKLRNLRDNLHWTIPALE